MADGQMTQSTYLEIDACPGRISTLETSMTAAQGDISALQTSAQNTGKMLDYIKELGIKNRMPQVRRIGTSNSNAATTYTHNGVTYTVNSDGTITVQGSSGRSSDSIVWLYDDFSAILADGVADGTYYFSTGFTGDQSTARMRVKTGSGSTDFLVVSQYATIPETGYSGMNVSIIVYAAFTGELTVKPMFVKKFLYDADPSWEPYAPTGKELLDIIHKYHTSASASLRSYSGNFLSDDERSEPEQPFESSETSAEEMR